MPPSPSKDPLRDALSAWQIRPARDASFRSSVWTRIDRARKPSTWMRFARSHPAAVGALFMAAVVFGAISGRVEARDRSAADRDALATNYVHGLDARWMRHQ